MLFLIMVHLILLSSPGLLLSTDHCYTDIGCFPITPEFYHPRYRPVNVRPWHRSRIKTTFTLFNNEQSDAGFVMQPWNHLNLQASRFNPLLETKIIIPGWLDNMKRTLWVKKLKDSFLWLWDPVNIIVVEWVNFTPYTIATANTRVVGAEIANMLKFLEEVYEYKRDYYHLIGHSLGAHIAAYCGDRLPGLGRITALDPARPFFQHMPKSIRLDRGDAKFVDAIHSDFTPENAYLLFITSFGLTTPVGHVDFFPNGPPLLQPGCFRDTMFSIPRGISQALRHNSIVVGFMEAIRYLVACDHQRAHEWFIESVTNQDCMFVGVRCSDYDGVVNGRCSCDDSKAACAIMGIHADQMYLHNAHEDLPKSLQLMNSIEYPQPLPQMPPPPPTQLQLQLQLQPPQVYPQQQLQQQQLQQQHHQHRQQQTYDHNDRDRYLIQTPHDADVDAEGGLIIDDDSRDDHNYFDGDVNFDDVIESSDSNRRLAIQTVVTKQAKKLNKKQAITNHQNLLNLHHHHQSSVLTNNHANSRNLQPRLLSDINHEIESWYENNNRWFLMTNNKRLYCVHQYQVLIFVGYLPKIDSIKANLIMSIIGTNGRLLNQRFKPKSGKLSSHSLQPFYVVFESAFSLGIIKSVTLAWEPTNRQEPSLKAKIELTSPQVLTKLQNQYESIVTPINIHLPYRQHNIQVQSTKNNNQLQHIDFSHLYAAPNRYIDRRDEVFSSPSSALVNAHSIWPMSTDERTLMVTSVSATTKNINMINSENSNGQHQSSRVTNELPLISAHLQPVDSDRINHQVRHRPIKQANYCKKASPFASLPPEQSTYLHNKQQVYPGIIQLSENLHYNRGTTNLHSHSHSRYLNSRPAPLPRPTQLSSHDNVVGSGSHHQAQILMAPQHQYYHHPDPFLAPLHRPQVMMIPEEHYQHHTKVKTKANTIDLLLATLSRHRDDAFLVVNQIRITPIQAYYGKNLHIKVSKTFCPPHKHYPIPHKQTVQFRSSPGNC